MRVLGPARLYAAQTAHRWVAFQRPADRMSLRAGGGAVLDGYAFVPCSPNCQVGCIPGSLVNKEGTRGARALKR